MPSVWQVGAIGDDVYLYWGQPCDAQVDETYGHIRDSASWGELNIGKHRAIRASNHRISEPPVCFIVDPNETRPTLNLI
jgi:hypothetical protein